MHLPPHLPFFPSNNSPLKEQFQGTTQGWDPCTTETEETLVGDTVLSIEADSDSQVWPRTEQKVHENGIDETDQDFEAPDRIAGNLSHNETATKDLEDTYVREKLNDGTESNAHTCDDQAIRDPSPTIREKTNEGGAQIWDPIKSSDALETSNQITPQAHCVVTVPVSCPPLIS